MIDLHSSSLFFPDLLGYNSIFIMYLLVLHFPDLIVDCFDFFSRGFTVQKMSQKGLIYSFVAKGTVVLAEHTPYSGNFSTIAVQCLQKLPTNSSKYTYSCDAHTFNFLVDNGFGEFS